MIGDAALAAGSKSRRVGEKIPLLGGAAGISNTADSRPARSTIARALFALATIGAVVAVIVHGNPRIGFGGVSLLGDVADAGSAPAPPWLGGAADREDPARRAARASTFGADVADALDRASSPAVVATVTSAPTLPGPSSRFSDPHSHALRVLDANGESAWLGRRDHSVDLASADHPRHRDAGHALAPRLGDADNAAAAADPFAEYFEESSRAPVGGSSAKLGRRFTDVDRCVAACDEMGHGCAGFTLTARYLSHGDSCEDCGGKSGAELEDCQKCANANGEPFYNKQYPRYCTLVGRGYGLEAAAESDFYRKKTKPEDVHFEIATGVAVPRPDAFAWKAFEGTDVEEAKKFCARDSRCAGFYTCAEEASCGADLDEYHAAAHADAFAKNGLFSQNQDEVSIILLVETTSVSAMVEAKNVVTYTRGMKTCGGTANGLPCRFPFTTDPLFVKKQIEFYEPTIHGSDRPWCETTSGLKGYVDCEGQDPIGARFVAGEWSACPVTCGGGLQTKSLECRSSQGEKLPLQACGAPPETSRVCNAHSCNPGCEAHYAYDEADDVSEIRGDGNKNSGRLRKPICGAYYEDLRSQHRSKTTQRAACEEYGCCWSPSSEVGNQCYKSATQPVNPPGCKFGFEDLFAGGGNATSEVSQCDDRCCRGDATHGKCAYALGYANPSAPNPCGKYESEDFSRLDWFRFGPDKMANCKSMIETSRAESALECKAKCRLNGRCNTINFQKQQQVCDLMFCNNKEAFNTLSTVTGFDSYRWSAATNYRWIVGEWGDCREGALNPDGTVASDPALTPVAVAEENESDVDGGITVSTTEHTVEGNPDRPEMVVKLPTASLVETGFRGDVYPDDDERRHGACRHRCLPDAITTPLADVVPVHADLMGTHLNGHDSTEFAVLEDHSTRGHSPYVKYITGGTFDDARTCNFVTFMIRPKGGVHVYENGGWINAYKELDLVVNEAGMVSLMRSGDGYDDLTCDAAGLKAVYRKNRMFGAVAVAMTPSDGLTAASLAMGIRSLTFAKPKTAPALGNQDDVGFVPWREASTDNFLRHNECSLMKTREVTCVDQNDDPTDDNHCATLFKGKPPFAQRCFGACGITNRSCEELNWELTGMCHGPCRGAAADYKTCGSGAIGGKQPNGCWDDEKITIEEAEEHCEAAGTRLCTLEESAKGIMNAAKNWNGNAPVQCKGYYHWTSTRCDDGKGFFVSSASYGHGVSDNRCVSPNATFVPACCANYKILPIFEERFTHAWRDKMELKLGDYNYCNNERGYCQVGEGHTTVQYSGCVQGSMTAENAGPKYGFMPGIGVCIPQYNRHQISFSPRSIFKGVPTDIVFNEAGNMKLPEKAIVRVVGGLNPGCLGVEDGTAQILAETSLGRAGGHRVWRGEVRHNERDYAFHHRYDKEQLNDTQPYMKWDGLVLDSFLAMDDAPFENVFNHMCMCDSSEDCTVARNWHDLGRFVVDPEYFKFKQPNYITEATANTGRYTSGKNMLAVGGDLFEAYTTEDLKKDYPDFDTWTWGNQPHFQYKDAVIAQYAILNEWCASRCRQNPNCMGFEYSFQWGGAEDWCRLRNWEAKIIKTGGYRHNNRHNFQARKDMLMSDYYWFPTLNYTNAATLKWMNPNRRGPNGDHNDGPIGLTPDTNPEFTDIPPMAELSLESVRDVMHRKSDYINGNGGFKVHSGDGRILANTLWNDWRGNTHPQHADRGRHLSSGFNAVRWTDPWRPPVPVDASDASAGSFFEGGVYMQHPRRTCGGNSNGAPCSGQWSQDREDADLVNPPCHKVDAHDRPICYTKKNSFEFWGHCDCEEKAETDWTRPFARHETFHNAASRGGDVVLLTDAVPGPVTHLHCFSDNYGRHDDVCDFGINTTMCLHSETYGEYVPLARGPATDVEVRCPPGEVLTGFALFGKDGKMDWSREDNEDAGIQPRCGTPSGWKLVDNATSVTDTLVCDRASGENCHDGGGALYNNAWTACPAGHVAVGFSTGYQKKEIARKPKNALMCQPYVTVDAHPEAFARSCKKMDCDASSPPAEDPAATTEEACVDACAAKPLSQCAAAEFTPEGKCLIHAKACVESVAAPFGVAKRANAPKPYETIGARAVFTPVEFEHPVTRGELETYKVSNVPSSYFERDGAFAYFGTPWSVCDKSCGVGVQTRTVYCASMRNASVSAAVDEKNCELEEKIPDTQHCNKRHCEKQCAQDVGRRECARFKQNPLRNSFSPMIRQGACEAAGCCFLADPSPDPGTPPEPECYEQVELDSPEWIVSPFGECAAECSPTLGGNDFKHLTQRRKSYCSYVNGSAADRNECVERPVLHQNCNNHDACDHNYEQKKTACGPHGKLERLYRTKDTSKYDLVCNCYDGWTNNADRTCIHNQGCFYPCDVRKTCAEGEWVTGEWSACTAKTSMSGSVTARTRDVSCGCYDTCDEATKPATSEMCDAPVSAVQTASSTGDVLPESFEASSLAHFEQDFVVYDFRKIGAVDKTQTASVVSCVSMCAGKPRCPGVVYSGVASGGNCGIISIQAFITTKMTRSESSHLILRREIIGTSNPQPELAKLVAESDGEWTSKLAEEVVSTNEVLTKRKTPLALTDPIWSWINSVNRKSVAADAENELTKTVPLRKSMYSLSFPTHPNVIKHARYLKNFLQARSHDVDALGDLILGTAYKHRDLDWIVNSTDANIDAAHSTETFRDRCTFSGFLRTHHGKKYMPSPDTREASPAPAHAIDYLLNKKRAHGKDLASPISDAPWPIVVGLNTPQFPAGECDWAWSRLQGKPELSKDSWTNSSGLVTKWPHYGLGYTKNKVICKASNWHHNSLPRVAEDGGLCGRLAYMHIGTSSCMGTPSQMVGQPQHAAAITYESKSDGKRWTMGKFSWIFPAYWTTSSNGVPTDNLGGSNKLKDGSVDYMAAIPNGVNVGLDSYVDVRLAMLLFRTVYSNEGSRSLQKVASLLLSALKKNPHNIEAWELLITHFKLRTIRDAGMMREAYDVFKPYAKEYEKTYEYFLGAIAATYDCKSANSTTMQWLEAQIEEMAPNCGDAGKHLSLMNSVRECYVQKHGTGVEMVKHLFEPTLLKLAWGDCDDAQLVKRTNLNVNPGPVAARGMVAAMALLFGQGEKGENGALDAIGIAGDDYKAVFDYLVELEKKWPLGKISAKIPTDCSYGDGLGASMLAGSTLAIWKTSGKMLMHPQYKPLAQVLMRYAMMTGQWNTVASALAVEAQDKLRHPGPLRAAGRLTGSSKDYQQFITCTGYVDTSDVAALGDAADHDRDRDHHRSPVFTKHGVDLTYAPALALHAAKLGVTREDARDAKLGEASVCAFTNAKTTCENVGQPCTAVAAFYDGARTCREWCAKQTPSLACVASYTDNGNSCSKGSHDLGCDHRPHSSDDICECEPVGPPPTWEAAGNASETASETEKVAHALLEEVRKQIDAAYAEAGGNATTGVLPFKLGTFTFGGDHPFQRCVADAARDGLLRCPNKDRLRDGQDSIDDADGERFEIFNARGWKTDAAVDDIVYYIRSAKTGMYCSSSGASIKCDAREPGMREEFEISNVHRHRTPFGVASAGDQHVIKPKILEASSGRARVCKETSGNGFECVSEHYGHRERFRFALAEASTPADAAATAAATAREAEVTAAVDAADAARATALKLATALETAAADANAKETNVAYALDASSSAEAWQAARDAELGGEGVQGEEGTLVRDVNGDRPEMYATRGVHHDTFAFNVSMFEGLCDEGCVACDDVGMTCFECDVGYALNEDLGACAKTSNFSDAAPKAETRAVEDVVIPPRFTPDDAQLYPNVTTELTEVSSDVPVAHPEGEDMSESARIDFERARNLRGCELTCEGYGYDAATCDGIEGCWFEENPASERFGECVSAVGPNLCDCASREGGCVRVDAPSAADVAGATVSEVSARAGESAYVSAFAEDASGGLNASESAAGGGSFDDVSDAPAPVAETTTEAKSSMTRLAEDAASVSNAAAEADVEREEIEAQATAVSQAEPEPAPEAVLAPPPPTVGPDLISAPKRATPETYAGPDPISAPKRATPEPEPEAVFTPPPPTAVEPAPVYVPSSASTPEETTVTTRYAVTGADVGADALDVVERAIKRRLAAGIKFHGLETTRVDDEDSSVSGKMTLTLSFSGFRGKPPKAVKRFSQVSAGPRTIAGLNKVLANEGVVVSANFRTDSTIAWNVKHSSALKRAIGAFIQRARKATAESNAKARTHWRRMILRVKRLLNGPPPASSGASLGAIDIDSSAMRGVRTHASLALLGAGLCAVAVAARARRGVRGRRDARAGDDSERVALLR